jgi:hypothetical protein
MLADNADTAITTDKPTQLAAQTKQPFGGVIASNQPEPAMQPAMQPTAQPTAHPPVTVEGKKFYSLAGIIHRGGSEVHMPLLSEPDVRLKSSNLKSISIAKAPDNKTFDTKTFDTKTAQELLGLGEPIIPLAAAPNFSSPNSLSPGFSPDALPPITPPKAGNQLPPQLIEDMMLMNMQKYQNGLKNGSMRGASVDVEG